MGLDTVEFVMAVERELELEIPDADAERIATPGQMVSYLTTRRTDLPRAEIEAVIRRLMNEELGITEFGWDQTFHDDLGVD